MIPYCRIDLTHPLSPPSPVSEQASTSTTTTTTTATAKDAKTHHTENIDSNLQGLLSLWDVCRYDDIVIHHRTQNVLIRFPAAVFGQASVHSSVCLLQLVTSLADQPMVTRMAIGRPMRLMNNVAR